MEYQCSICSSILFSSRSLVRHYRIHIRQINTFRCFFKNCKWSSRFYSQFKSHVYYRHQQHVLVKRLPGNVISCYIKDCQETFSVTEKFLKHITSHFDSIREIECPMKDCRFSYRLLESYRAHLSRCHSTLMKAKMFKKDCFRSSSESHDFSSDQTLPIEDHSVSLESNINNDDLDIGTTHIDSGQMVAAAVNRESLQLSIAKFYLELQGKYLSQNELYKKSLMVT